MDRMVMNRMVLVVASALLPLAGCAAANSKPETAGETATEKCVDCIEATGYVRYSRVEGGFWYLEADDAAKYDPYGVPETFAQDGLRVKFTVRPQPERMGFHMIGTIVELVSIERLPGSEAPPERPGR